ncbi:hypothetical protein AB1207_04800 [Kineococcus endophyticus]|uniref:2TM domain-containing protein n=1 Tax=Kineococcus endophyticus TaxID=1181883 RepID=A0ABV3P344_9ACTN
MRQPRTRHDLGVLAALHVVTALLWWVLLVPQGRWWILVAAVWTVTASVSVVRWRRAPTPR